MDNNTTAAQKLARTGTSGVPVRAIVISGVLFAFSLMIYAGLEFGYKPFLNVSIKSLNDQISSLDNSAPADDKEQNFIRFYSLATNIGKLLRDHVAVSPVLDLFEERTLSDVVLEATKVTVSDGTALISGAAKGYDRLATQLAIYGESPSVSRAGLVSSRYRDNAIQFEANISFIRDIFSATKFLEKITVTTAENTTTNEGATIQQQ